MQELARLKGKHGGQASTQFLSTDFVVSYELIACICNKHDDRKCNIVLINIYGPAHSSRNENENQKKDDKYAEDFEHQPTVARDARIIFQ